MEHFMGIDESGRGSLFGPLFVCGVVFKDNVSSTESWYTKLNDSKQLTKAKRKELVPYIKDNAYYHICNIPNTEIDNLNILQATYKGMNECILALKIYSNDVYIDGNRFQPSQDNLDINYKCIVKGDSKYKSIMAASILAKEMHDMFIKNLLVNNPTFDLYDIQNNMGYGTKKHREALTKHGFTEYHRKTFSFKPLS